jgi:protein-disulfide isomerase
MLKVLSLVVLLGTAVTVHAKVTPPQTEEINKVVAEYIQQNPQAIIDSLQNHSKKQEQEAIAKLNAGVTASKDQLSDSKGAIVIGKEDAAVKLVIFVDPNCPHCRVLETAISDIEKDLPGKEKLGILVRQWPILGDNSKVVSAGLIAAYAQDPKKFTDLSTKLINSKEPMDEAKFINIAKESGFDTAKLEAAMKSDAVMTQLKNTQDLAVKIGLEATPTLILSDKTGARLVQVGDKAGLQQLLSDAIKAS